MVSRCSEMINPTMPKQHAKFIRKDLVSVFDRSEIYCLIPNGISLQSFGGFNPSVLVIHLSTLSCQKDGNHLPYSKIYATIMSSWLDIPICPRSMYIYIYMYIIYIYRYSIYIHILYILYIHI